MIFLKIIDFDHGLGGFTTGMEQYDDFEVVAAPWLNADTNLCYNVNHKNFFDQDTIYTDEFYKKNDFDIAVFSPFFGDGYKRRGSTNFSYQELDESIFWIQKFLPNIAIIITDPFIINFMDFNVVSLSKTADGWPVYDKICNCLENFYNVYQFVIDGAAYGVPQHKKVNFYFCVHKEFDFYNLSLPKPIYNHKNGFISIRDAIGDINDKHYSDYTSSYITWCTINNPKLTWHDLNFKNTKDCSFVKQGHSAKDTSELTQKRGYVRPKYDFVAPKLDKDFYLTSSKFASVHPVCDRPFTIREGARLFGLPDTFVWNTSLTKKTVARLIFNSVSPIFGSIVAKMMLDGLK